MKMIKKRWSLILALAPLIFYGLLWAIKLPLGGTDGTVTDVSVTAYGAITTQNNVTMYEGDVPSNPIGPAGETVDDGKDPIRSGIHGAPGAPAEP